MARSNTGSTSNFLTNASAVVSGAPLTMVGWINPANITDDHILCSISCPTTAEGWFFLGALGSTGGDPVGASVIEPAGEQIAVSASGFSANVPNHCAAVFASATSRTAYLNGVPGTTNTPSRTPTGLTRTDVGALRGISGVYAVINARISEVAIWNVALTTKEIDILAKGFSPLFVRPWALVSYWPLTGRISPEPDFVGVSPLSITGTMAQAAHSPIWMPTGPMVSLAPSVAPPTHPPGMLTLGVG